MGSKPSAKLPLSADLVARGYGLREEREDDLPFLAALYPTSREEELRAVNWPAEQMQAFMTQQFLAQRRHYRSAITHCRFEIIERDGTPVGRLYRQERDTVAHLVDITLLPMERGVGIGTAIIQTMIADAQARGKGVTLFVEPYKPARNLYERLGFKVIAEHQAYLEMEREVAPVPALN